MSRWDISKARRVEQVVPSEGAGYHAEKPEDNGEPWQILSRGSRCERHEMMEPA